MLDIEAIAKLMNSIDIKEAVKAFIDLRKKGSEYVACCPFHDEKTASFTISNNKYYCFGCGAGGNVVGFIMNYNNMNFTSAVKYLAKEFNLDIKDEEIFKNEKLLSFLNSINLDWQKELGNTNVMNYMRRRIDDATIFKFGLGYCNPNYCNEKDNLASELSIKKTKYMFGGRVTIPITNEYGSVVGFGGRCLDNNGAKYINSPESVVFHKGDLLYGLFENAKGISKNNRIIVCEGYFDVMALSSYGIDYAVASMGTACTDNQIKLLMAKAKHITFCFDGDLAGVRAAKKVALNLMPFIRDSYKFDFLFMPDNLDPEEYLNEYSKKSFIDLLNNAKVWSNYMLDILSERINVKQIEDYAILKIKVDDVLMNMHNSIIKQELKESFYIKSGKFNNLLIQSANELNKLLGG
jgi:DNA primase